MTNTEKKLTELSQEIKELIKAVEQLDSKVSGHKTMSSKGGTSTLQKHGANHFKEIANKRWAKEKIK